MCVLGRGGHKTETSADGIAVLDSDFDLLETLGKHCFALKVGELVSIVYAGQVINNTHTRAHYTLEQKHHLPFFHSTSKRTHPHLHTYTRARTHTHAHTPMLMKKSYFQKALFANFLLLRGGAQTLFENVSLFGHALDVDLLQLLHAKNLLQLRAVLLQRILLGLCKEISILEKQLCISCASTKCSV